MTDNHDPDEPFTTDGPIGEMMDDIRLRGPKAMFRDHQIEQAAPLGQPAKDFVGAVQQYARLVHEAIAEEVEVGRRLSRWIGAIESRVDKLDATQAEDDDRMLSALLRLDDHSQRVQKLEARERPDVVPEIVELRQRLDRLANRMAEIDARSSRVANHAALVRPEQIRGARALATASFTVACVAVAVNIASALIWFFAA